jgi:hypothetical protein
MTGKPLHFLCKCIKLLHCVDYLLLNPRHISVKKDSVQKAYHIKGRLYNSCI